MAMIRVWLRRWLGMDAVELAQRNTATDVKSVYVEINDLDRRIQVVEKQPTFADISRKQFEIDLQIKELKEMKEAAADPKRIPVVARSMRQFKALMEQD